ncbi:MAG: hypothetical protein JJT96_20505 [Opitutales bacterium]|nr:hypothetical protein [Opitutales bacterium]
MSPSLIPPLLLFLFFSLVCALHGGDRVFYLEAEGHQRFNGVLRLSDGTLLVRGQADSMI